MITAAYYANDAHDAVITVTGDLGHVLISTPDEAAALAAWQDAGGAIAPFAAPRQAQALAREAFCVALVGVGIFTEDEAEHAALGNWPPKFEPALAGKTLIEKLTAKNLWQGAKTVARDAPLFTDLLAFYGQAQGLDGAQTQALGDAIFAGAPA